MADFCDIDKPASKSVSHFILLEATIQNHIDLLTLHVKEMLADKYPGSFKWFFV